MNIVLFRTTSHGFYTNVHWKCTNREETGWFTDRFDDTFWPNAQVWPESDFNFYSDARFSLQHHPDAKFIWSDDATHDVIFCRATLCRGLSNSHAFFPPLMVESTS